MNVDDRIEKRVEALVGKGQAVLDTRHDLGGAASGISYLDLQQYSNWRTQSLAFLSDILGREHAYTENFQLVTQSGARPESAQAGIGILEAVQEDIQQGYVEKVRQLIRAELLSDFFDQATHLLENEYTAAAASLAGAALENGLRSVAAANEIQVRESDNLQSLNQKIADKEVYSRLDQKKVSFWTDVRNEADHGHFEKLKEQDVEDLIKGAQSFLADRT